LAGRDVVASSACPARTIRLYRDADFRGKKGEYHCAGRQGQEFSGINMRNYFVGTSTNRHLNVSSYVNNGVPSAALNAIAWDRVFPLHGGGNMPRAYNDGAQTLNLHC
jgi:hypothetical protein